MKFESRKTGEVLYVADSQAKTIRHMIMSGRYKVVGDAEWKESDHPRGANGQFGSGGGSSGSSKQEMEHNLDRMKKNIAWMEKGRPPQEKAGSHRRQLKELRESYATLKAKHEKEHGGSKEKSPEVKSREQAHVTHTKRLNNIKSGIVEHMESIAQSKGEDPDGYFDKSEFNDIIKDIENGGEPSWMDLGNASKEERSQLVSRLKSYFE